MWKIVFGVALGIVLAGIISTAGWMLFTGALIKGITDAFQQHRPQLTNSKPLQIVPLGTDVQQNQPIKTDSQLIADPVRTRVIDPSRTAATQLINGMSREILRGTTYGQQIEKREKIIEDSKNAYKQVQNDVASFKAQYKKPPECYDIKNDATRIHCANEFIRARKAYEALNQQ